MATAEEMKSFSVDELERREGELREAIFQLRIKHRTGELASSAELPKNRKELARVMTFLSAKRRGA